jgi:hypothetical protein
MTLEIERYTHIPLYVQAVRVTDENLDEVAEWCEGTICSIERDGKDPVDYVKVATIRPMRERQTQAFPGDWVLKTGIGIKVYTDKAFKRAFVEAPESDPAVLARAEEIFKEPVKA